MVITGIKKDAVNILKIIPMKVVNLNLGSF